MFKIIKHNYLMGFKREDILKALHDRVKRGETLQQIFDSMPFFNEKNKRNARTISVMGVSSDRWALRFTEILMADRKDALDTIQYWEYVDQVALLAFFFAVRGVNRKSMMQIAWLVLVGMGVSEVRALEPVSFYTQLLVICYAIYYQKQQTPGRPWFCSFLLPRSEAASTLTPPRRVPLIQPEFLRIIWGDFLVCWLGGVSRWVHRVRRIIPVLPVYAGWPESHMTGALQNTRKFIKFPQLHYVAEWTRSATITQVNHFFSGFAIIIFVKKNHIDL